MDFRREDDAAFIFRVNQHQPKGYPNRIAKYVSVAGVSYRQPAVIAFIEGRNREVIIRPEVVTEGRAPSLAVYGKWDDWEGGTHEAHLGYVPKEVHAAIGETPVVATLEAMYQAGNDRTAGLRLDIWQPRPKKEK